MNAIIAIAFPIVASALAFAFVLTRRGSAKKTVAKRWHAVAYFLSITLGFNLAASVAFGIYIVASAPTRSSDSLWFLPIFVAPIEYWLRFGPALLIANTLLAIPVATILVRQTRR